jgi:hypothetical protein
MTHTPGPWLINDADAENQSIEIIADVITVDNSLNIATVYGGFKADAEMMANAFLIAAAPDMLHALKTVEKYALESMDYKNVAYVLHLIQAVISKAEGRQGHKIVIAEPPQIA